MDNNEVVKQEKKKHGKDIVIIVLVFVIALLLGIIIGQFALNNNSKNSAENVSVFMPSTKESTKLNIPLTKGIFRIVLDGITLLYSCISSSISLFGFRTATA